MADLSAIVKAYDIRGVIGEQIDAEEVHETGAAFAHLFRGPGGPGSPGGKKGMSVLAGPTDGTWRPRPVTPRAKA